MANTLKFGNGQWATGNGTALAYNDENSNFKPLPFDFTRASSGTVVNQSGLIETVGSGIPRIDFLGSEDGAMLLEPSRSNLVTTSETLSNYWSLQGATLIVDNQAVNPTGSLYANKLNTSSTATFKGLTKSQSTAYDGKTLNVSIFAKKITNDYIFFYNIGSTSGVSGIWFNISNGNLGSIGGAWSNSKIENYGNGWYRCSSTITFGTDTNFLYLLNSDGNGNTTSTIGSQTYLWGSQLEEGSYATSYIPTSGSAVTRVVETCSQTAPDGVIGQTEGAIFFDLNTVRKNYSVISISDGSNNNRVVFYFSNVLNQIASYITKSNVNSSTISSNVNSYPNSNYKVVIKYNSIGFYVFANGQLIGTILSDYSFPNNTLSEIKFSSPDNTNLFEGKVKNIKVYNQSLTDQEAIALTQV